MEKRRKKLPKYTQFYIDTFFEKYNYYLQLSKKYVLTKDENEKFHNLKHVINNRSIEERLNFYHFLKDELKTCEKIEDYKTALKIKNVLDNYIMHFLG